MDRFLVIGGAGLVGSHLCDRILAAGHEVIAVDDLSAGSWANVAHLRREPRFAFVEHDVARPFRVRADAVFHLAVPSRPRCGRDAQRGALTRTLGMAHALEAAAEHGAPVIVAAARRGPSSSTPIAEALAAEFATWCGLDVRTVRIERPYGPRMAPDDDHAVCSLLLRALAGEALPTSRDPTRLRVAYVDDVVSALLSAARGGTAEPPREIVAPYVETTHGEVSRTVGEVLGAPITGDIPAASGGPVDLREGVRRTALWFVGRVGLATPPRRQDGASSRSDRAAASF